MDDLDIESTLVPCDYPRIDLQFGGSSPPRLPSFPLQVNLDVSGNNVRIEDHWMMVNERFGVDGVAYRFVPDLEEEVEDIVRSFDLVIDEIFDHLRTNFDHRDYVEVLSILMD